MTNLEAQQRAVGDHLRLHDRVTELERRLALIEARLVRLERAMPDQSFMNRARRALGAKR